MANIIQKLIDKLDWGDYYFIVLKNSEYNTTGKTELHNIDSVKPILVGNLKIIGALVNDWITRKIYY